MSLQRWPLGFSDNPSYAAPLTPWASFPAALTAEGQIRRPAELPHVSLIALSGLWRPLGGRQVLASRFINPVTVQNLTDFRAETIGPFPGGLVRAGMQLRLNWMFGIPGLGTVTRRVQASLGVIGHTLPGKVITYLPYSTSNALASGWLDTYVNVLSDGSALVGLPSSPNQGGLSPLSNGHIASPSGVNTCTANFSQNWEIGLWANSAAETAITITGATWSAGVATYTTSANHTLAVGDKDVVSGITPSGWNTTAIVSAVGSPTTFSVPMDANPGAYTSGGSSSRISNVESRSYSLELWG